MAAAAPSDRPIAMRLVAVRYAAHETNIYEFEALDRAPLPDATAGAHVDLHLGNGLVRSYSLLKADEPLRRYVVGVKRDAAGRGGSAFLHDRVRVGEVIEIGPPRNHFPLVEDASHTVLIAGGIGITPIWSMARRLGRLGRSFELHYACREPRDVVMRDELGGVERARLHVDAEVGSIMGLREIVEAAPEGSHFYCCGPAPMLAGYEDATRDLPSSHVHLERFAAAEPVRLEGSFTVVLADTGEEYAVPEGRSILDVLRDAGHEVDFSCEQGICGACRMRVVEGEPEHCDMVLSDEERAANDAMMICCSGSRSSRLVLASP